MRKIKEVLRLRFELGFGYNQTVGSTVSHIGKIRTEQRNAPLLRPLGAWVIFWPVRTHFQGRPRVPARSLDFIEAVGLVVFDAKVPAYSPASAEAGSATSSGRGSSAQCL